MEFSTINSKISLSIRDKSIDKFKALLCDLGIRNNNYFVGSGLGGDNFQLLVLLSLNHNLVNDDIKIEVANDRINWGAKYLSKTSLKEIRNDLHFVFKKIKEHHKYIALAIESLNESKTFKDLYESHKDFCPKIDAVFHGRSYNCDENSNYENLVASYLMCARLSNELDDHNKSNIENIGKVLNKFDPEMILLAVRKFIGIGRIIKYDLDSYSQFGKCLDKVVNTIVV